MLLCIWMPASSFSKECEMESLSHLSTVLSLEQNFCCLLEFSCVVHKKKIFTTGLVDRWYSLRRRDGEGRGTHAQMYSPYSHPDGCNSALSARGFRKRLKLYRVERMREDIFFHVGMGDSWSVLGLQDPLVWIHWSRLHSSIGKPNKSICSPRENSVRIVPQFTLGTLQEELMLFQSSSGKELW